MSLMGQTFNSWTVLRYYDADSQGRAIWWCKCRCGAEKEVFGYNLTSSRSKMCRRCSALQVGEKYHRTHGLTHTKEYRAWVSMKTRCYNEKHSSFRYHGALGVKVHPLFLESFEAFLLEIGPAPTSLHTVDRSDPFGDYAPGNLRWATQAEQMANTRRAVKHAKRNEQERWPWLR